jgi:hypothetical protein
MTAVTRDNRPATTDPGDLIGTLRSIGPDGPTYEVCKIIDDETAVIRILECEREVEYPVRAILADPGPDAAWKRT